MQIALNPGSQHLLILADKLVDVHTLPIRFPDGSFLSFFLYKMT